ncbi:MAG: G5 domain-containing protein [Ruminococcus sp.]|nr:G5 domain-containing protein [Ruminococcus sp.]
MNIRAKRLCAIRLALALTLVTLIMGLSAMTTATAVQDTDNINGAVSKADESFETSGEYHLASGELLVTNIKDFAVSVDVIDGKNVTIKQDGEETTVKIAKGIVADALEHAGINVDGTQIVYPTANTVINDDITVTIKQVTYEEKTETKPIAFETIKKVSDECGAGETKVHQKGVKGEKQITKKIKYIDGEKVSEEIIETKTTKKPVDEIIYVGMEELAVETSSNSSNASVSSGNTFTDYNGATVAFKQVINGSGTAYTAPAGALTATGVAAYHGGVAVNPNIIPYGSKLYITSTDGSVVYGYATAVDTGGALMEGSALVDCFYNSYDECVSFGRRNVNVYIL